MRVEEAVGSRIKHARERAGITQEQLGMWLEPLLGRVWPRQSISLAEQGKRAFTAVELVAIAYVVGVSPAVLFQIPPGTNAVEMPSGKSLTREELRRASHAGEGGPGIAADRVRQTLSNLMLDLEEVGTRNAEIKYTVQRLHDEVGLAVNALTPTAPEGS